MSNTLRQAVALGLLTFSLTLAAQDNRPSCVILKGLDLKSLLGADHDAPVPFGKDSCRAEANRPGKMVILGVMEEKPAGLKQWLTGIRKINTVERAKEVTTVAEPLLGPEAFSVRDRRELRHVEFYAVKGARAVVVQASWDIGPPLNDTEIKQLQQVAKGALDKLP